MLLSIIIPIYNVDRIANCRSKPTYAVNHFASSWRTKEEINQFNRLKRKQYYKGVAVILKKTVRRMTGDGNVGRIKEKVKSVKR